MAPFGGQCDATAEQNALSYCKRLTCEQYEQSMMAHKVIQWAHRVRGEGWCSRVPRAVGVALPVKRRSVKESQLH